MSQRVKTRCHVCGLSVFYHGTVKTSDGRLVEVCGEQCAFTLARMDLKRGGVHERQKA